MPEAVIIARELIQQVFRLHGVADHTLVLSHCARLELVAVTGFARVVAVRQVRWRAEVRVCVTTPYNHVHVTQKRLRHNAKHSLANEHRKLNTDSART